ncbi:MAG: hypothetical protein ACKVOW_00415 [Chitinophagaceae bacterium]
MKYLNTRLSPAFFWLKSRIRTETIPLIQVRTDENSTCNILLIKCNNRRMGLLPDLNKTGTYVVIYSKLFFCH